MEDQAAQELSALRSQLNFIHEATGRALSAAEALANRIGQPPAPQPADGGAAEKPDRGKWLTPKQAAEEFNVTRKWVYTHWREIEPNGKAGRLVRVRRSSMEKYMQRCRENS